MITNVQIDYLDDGAIPIYGEFPPSDGLQHFYTIDDTLLPPSWSIRAAPSDNRFIVPLQIDLSISELEEKLRGWLNALDGENGSLIFAIRGVINLDRLLNEEQTEEALDTATCVCGGHLYEPHHEGCPLSHIRDFNWVIAGLAFLPGIEFGTPLNGADPIAAILDSCRMYQAPTILAENGDFGDRQRPTQDALRRILENKQRKATIEQRARTLFRECLNPAQLWEWERFEEFHVAGADGYTYAIQPGQGHNVFRVEDGGRTVEFCIVTKDYTPTFDLMLAQKLLLEREPAAFHDKANSWWLDAFWLG